jgi:hypothetical protein
LLPAILITSKEDTDTKKTISGGIPKVFGQSNGYGAMANLKNKKNGFR